MDAETVRLLLSEQLPTKELARTARHLGSCSKCRDAIVQGAGVAARSPEAQDPSRVARELSARAPGNVVAGKYRLVSLLGRGGYSSVWRAERVDWQAPVALKLLVPPREASREFFARFEREVRLVAALRSPHVVQVLDHGIDESTGQAFIALELLEGETLDERLRREARLSLGSTIQILEQVARAVDRAHSLGIVHRDLKPANIFIARDSDREIVKVLDLGVAKSRMRQDILAMVTSPGTVLGTPSYMSPEQIRSSTDVDHHADLWSLAVIACECVTGRKPFAGKGFVEVALAVLDDSKRPVPSRLGPSSAGFDAWFGRATQLDRTRRFQTAREACDALLPLSRGSAARVGRQEPARRVTSVARFSKYLLFAVALGISGVSLYFTVRQHQEAALATAQASAVALSPATAALLPAPAPSPQPPALQPAPLQPAPSQPSPLQPSPASLAPELPTGAPRGASPGNAPRIAPVSSPLTAPPRTRERPQVSPARAAAASRRSGRAAGALPESSKPGENGLATDERPIPIGLTQ